GRGAGNGDGITAGFQLREVQAGAQTAQGFDGDIVCAFASQNGCARVVLFAALRMGRKPVAEWNDSVDGQAELPFDVVGVMHDALQRQTQEQPTGTGEGTDEDGQHQDQLLLRGNGVHGFDGVIDDVDGTYGAGLHDAQLLGTVE